MKKSIPIIRERESEAFILGNGREREFPLTPELNAVIGLPSLFSLFCVINTQEDDKQKHATFPDVFVHYASIYFVFM